MNGERDDHNLINFIATTVESMRDQMATKSDIGRLESKVEVSTAEIRGDLEQMSFRIDSIDRTLATRMGQIEGEISRLRSVLYLLVKDRPDMLRLLGHPTPGSENQI
jgi:hypothetical protein